MEDYIQRCKRLPDPTVSGLNLGHNHPSNKKAKSIAEWAEESAKLQAARTNRGIYEVLTDDEDCVKVIVGARVKLENVTALAMPCIERKTAEGNLRLLQIQLVLVRNSQVQKIQEHTGK